MKDARLYDLLIQVNINTKNQFMVYHDSICKYCPDTGRRTGACIIFYQGMSIDHVTHVPGPVDQSNTESEYNASCTA